MTPEKQAETEDLERAIREAVDAESGALAPHLATSDDAHPFGKNAFTIRALIHKIAARVLEPTSDFPHWNKRILSVTRAS
jgi:hypothetical protein